MSEAKKYIYKAEEIFEDIPDDPNNVNMKIPEEIAQEVGLKPGDKVKVLWGDQGTIIIQKAEEKETDGEG
jgi:formylmethanofuran dehydrogenase subunit D